MGPNDDAKAGAGGAETSPRTPLELPVDEVSLLEDRAHVIRRGSVDVGAGTTRLVVAGVAPVLSDRTLCASLRSPSGEEASGARVQDLVLRRRAVARMSERPEQAKALELERIALTDRYDAQVRRRERARAELRELAAIAQAQLVDVGVDASWGQVEPERWAHELTEIRADEATLRGQLLALDEELRELEAARERLERRARATADIREEITAELVIEIVSTSPRRFVLQVDYIVPGACWRPYHRAELVQADDGSQVVEFTCEGCVWQRTGEDWRGVQLGFSTERLSLGSEPPALESDVLRIRRRREVVEVEVRDQEIQTTGLGGETRAATELPGIDDGGEVLTLKASSRVDVLSDGQPHRTPLFSFTSEATLERVLVAELEPAVLLRTTQLHGGAQPLLAGPVDLIRGGGLVGRSSILFVAAGERFELGWGPDSALRALREVEREDEEKSMLSSWTSTVHTVALRLSNLGDEPRQITISERVPVSEIEKVKIEVDRRKTSEGKLADDQGIVTWVVDLGPFARRRLDLRYTIRKHSDVSGI